MKTQVLKLEEVQKHFDHWRQTRAKRCEIPTQLWQLAVQLTNNHFPTTVARALRLNCNDLKARIKSTKVDRTSFAQKQVDFVQVTHALSTAAPAQSNDMPMIELKRPDGITMRLQIQHSSFVTLCETFFRGPVCSN